MSQLPEHGSTVNVEPSTYIDASECVVALGTARNLRSCKAERPDDRGHVSPAVVFLRGRESIVHCDVEQASSEPEITLMCW
jgi:hypothetical protein